MKGILSIYATKAYEEVELYRHSILSSTLDGTGLSVSSLGPLCHRFKSPGSHWKGVWVHPTGDVDYLVRG